MIGRLMDWLRARRDEPEPSGLSAEVERRQDHLLSWSDHTTREFVKSAEAVNRLFEEIRQMERDGRHG